jgi:ribosomal protein L21E
MKQTSLTSKQQAKYDDALEVLRLVRKGTSFSHATKLVGINSATVKKKLGNAITKKNNRIIARKKDSLPRKLKIYENGKEVFITVKGTANSKKIARYHSAIGRRIDNNDKHALDSFDSITDANGRRHKLDTNIDSIISILQGKEDLPFFTIYKTR